MKHEHVIRSYQALEEGMLNPEERREIQRHLKECTECRTFFEKMSLLLDARDPSLLPTLEPDPFLPTRIRALQESRPATGGFRRAVGWARLSLASLAVLAAALSGVYLGAGLSTASRSVDDSEIIGAYYEAFSPTEFASGWEDLFENGDGDDQQRGWANGREENS